MKKLLFVISQLYKGGAETSLVNLLNNLDYSRYDVDLIILNQVPIENAVSLIDRINSKVNICDAYNEYLKINFMDRVRAKISYSKEQKRAFWFTALDFVKNKVYDWAFFVGEWCEPAFVAYHVKAKIKAVWIHSDISKAEYFNDEEYFYFHDCFDYYIFVSKNSLESSIKKYPFIKDKAVTIYNISDDVYIKKRSNEGVKDYNKSAKLPVLLTCANFRPEKNHLRQVEVMAELKNKGINFTWINIGSTADKELVNKVQETCKKYGLEENFLILGPKENPYSYMKLADAVTVLSDHESWSMVITEAKILGIPVIATRTSGALEQIEDNITGILTDFNVVSIAQRIENFLESIDVQESIRNNIKNFNNTIDILNSFNQLIDSPPRRNQEKKDKVLYIIDDINYLSGALTATINQINEFLKEGVKDISVFSGTIPKVQIRNSLLGVKFLTWRDCKDNEIYNHSLLNCIFDKDLTIKDKRYRIKLSYEARIKKSKDVFDKYVLPRYTKLFSKFDIICVMAENSAFRETVANTECKKKIQWIHIDYCDWKCKSEWTKWVTRNDSFIYSKFDIIVVLTDSIKQEFINLYPHTKNKVVVNKNIIPVNDIIKKSNEDIYNKKVIKFVSVGRFDQQKAYPRLIRILERVYEDGYRFHWTIIGDGNEFIKVKQLIENGVLRKSISLKGVMNNPFIEVKKADVFALLSDYEGLPNTIFEALILGIPVLATDVGGVKTQVTNNVNGWVIPNNEKSIYDSIVYILNHKEEIENVKNNLKNYKYDNEEIMKINNSIFSLY